MRRFLGASAGQIGNRTLYWWRSVRLAENQLPRRNLQSVRTENQERLTGPKLSDTDKSPQLPPLYRNFAIPGRRPFPDFACPLLGPRGSGTGTFRAEPASLGNLANATQFYEQVQQSEMVDF
jgi:hypothetical protein